MFSQCRHQGNTWSNVSEYVYGTKGQGNSGVLLDNNGNEIWRFQGPDNNPYDEEHRQQVEWIRNGVAHNDGWFAAYSSMTSAFGRMAGCSGQELNWDDVIENGKSEFPYEQALAGTMDWDTLPPILPDTEPPAQPAEGQLIYENSVPVPGEWKWQA